MYFTTGNTWKMTFNKNRVSLGQSFIWILSSLVGRLRYAVISNKDPLFSNQSILCVKTSVDTFLTRYMTIDKVPDCIGVMKFERVKDGDENEEKEVDLDDWYPKTIFALFSYRCLVSKSPRKDMNLNRSMYERWQWWAGGVDLRGYKRWIQEADPRIIL